MEDSKENVSPPDSVFQKKDQHLNRTPSTKLSTLQPTKILQNLDEISRTSVASTLIICIFKMLGHCSRILVTVSLWAVDDSGFMEND